MKGWQPPDQRRHFKDSDELCEHMARMCGGACLLSFSRGKDAIAAWLQLRKHFDRVVPFYLYQVPGLRIDRESLAYYEDFFGVRIHRFPNPSLYRWLDNYLFQPPDRTELMDELELHWSLTREEIADALRELHQLPMAYTATGVRAADSIVRGMSIRKHGAVNHKTRTFHAVFDWRIDQLTRAFTEAGVKLPPDYFLWGRTLDGLDHRFTEKLRAHYPDDYERLHRWFPLLHLDTLRRQSPHARFKR